MALALHGLKVLDFSTLLPGPMASLILAEAGAEVVKVERPGGEDMRRYPPVVGEVSANFLMLNRGKSCLRIDLKDPEGRKLLQPYLEAADVLIDQFRPGVMDRLGLGYEDLKKVNPGLIYCSITGYGQGGIRRDQAGHDLNYMAETGVLGLACDATGAPVLPPILAGDIGGGTFPAVINILLALRKRDSDGQGSFLDISMADNLFTFAYWGIASGMAAGHWPKPGGELVTGGSPRYHIYRTKDDRFLAVAPIEERFWATFCDAIGLTDRDDGKDPAGVTGAVAAIIATRTAAGWLERLAGLDTCVTLVATLEEAAADPGFKARGVFAQTVTDGTTTLPALPVPVAPALRRSEAVLGYARLGDANGARPWSKGEQP